MYSVLLNSKDERYSYYTFYDRFLQICEEHKNNDRALAFAFILYDFSDAQISKVLQDPNYWLSLNAVSGKYLTVFSFNYKPKIRYKGKGNYKISPNMSQYLTSIDDFNNPSESSNSLIEKYFGKDIEIKYPAVMFFQVRENKVIDYSLIELNEHEIELAFNELKNYISKAVEALKHVTEKNKGNSREIFKLVEAEVKGVQTKIKLKKAFRNLTSIIELASAIVGLEK